MPFVFTLDRARRRILVESQDPLTIEDVLETFERQAAEGAWSYGLLHDASATTWVPASADVRRMLDRITRISRRLGTPRGPVAFVAGSTAGFGMGRMYSMLGEDGAFEVQIFSTREQAQRWLDQEPAGHA